MEARLRSNRLAHTEIYVNLAHEYGMVLVVANRDGSHLGEWSSESRDLRQTGDMSGTKAEGPRQADRGDRPSLTGSHAGSTGGTTLGGFRDSLNRGGDRPRSRADLKGSGMPPRKGTYGLEESGAPAVVKQQRGSPLAEATGAQPGIITPIARKRARGTRFAASKRRPRRQVSRSLGWRVRSRDNAGSVVVGVFENGRW